jgi:hypothetical protein
MRVKTCWWSPKAVILLFTEALGPQSIQECQAFSPVVRIGSSRPLTHKRVMPPPLRFRGGDTLACGREGEGTQLGQRGRHSSPSTAVTLTWSKYVQCAFNRYIQLY